MSSEDAPDYSAVNLPQVFEHDETPRWVEDFMSTLEKKIRKLLEERDWRYLEEIRQLSKQIALQREQMQGVSETLTEIIQNLRVIATVQSRINIAVQEIKTIQEQRYREQGKQLNELA